MKFSSLNEKFQKKKKKTQVNLKENQMTQRCGFLEHLKCLANL